MSLDWFSATAGCPKCAGSQVGASYHDRARPIWDCWPDRDYPHIKRTCLRCGFCWDELPLDTEVPREHGTYPNICGALAPVPANGYCTFLPNHEGAHDSGYMVYNAASRGYIQEAVKE